MPNLLSKFLVILNLQLNFVGTTRLKLYENKGRFLPISVIMMVTIDAMLL
jgi:hypothetical protein